MNLLQKASIITTPTAYAEDYLYSIKPAQSLGAEIIPDPNFDTDTTSYWNIANTGGTPRATKSYISNDKFMRLTYDLANGAALFKSGAIVSGKSYKVIFRAKGTANSAFASIGNNGNLGTVISNPTLTTSFQRYEFNITATQTVFRLYLANASVGNTLDIDNISLKEITDADFDFDRNSTGTRVNEDYLIEDVPYNLVTYSQDFSQWSKSDATITNSSFNAPDGTETASTLTTSASGGTVQKNLTVSNGNVTFSVFVKKGTTDGVRLRIDAATDSNGYFNLVNNTVHSSTNGAKIENYGNGWYRVSISDNITSFVKVSIYTTDGTTSYDNGTLHIWGAQIVKGDQPKDYLKTTDRLDIPRIDYTNGEPSILLEPQRVNLNTSSTDLSVTSVWPQVNATITTSSELSPEGLSNAFLQETTSASSSYIANPNVSVTTGVTYTFSVFVKRVNHRWIRIAHSSSTQTGCWFDLDNGEVGTVNSTSASIQKYPNGWYRITNTFVAITNSSSTLFFIACLKIFFNLASSEEFEAIMYFPYFL